MAKRKGKSTNISSILFDDVDPYGAVVGQPLTQSIERLSLDMILPDPNQPRQILPENLCHPLYSGAMTPIDVMIAWRKQVSTAKSETGVAAMRELQRLANSIAQHGLINPITVRPVETGEVAAPVTYLIVTGERRYWAHILLLVQDKSITEGDVKRKPDEIKVSLTADGVLVRAHQIIENLMREDINVIEKARGLWALRYELSYDAYRRHSPSASDDDAYRRHSPSAYPEDMPLEPWRRVEETLDMSRQYRARIINVLKLSEEAQQLIQNHDLAEATIRPVVDKLRAYPDLQLVALQQLIEWQQEESNGDGGRRIVPSLRLFVEQLLAQVTTAKDKPVNVSPEALSLGRLRKRIKGVTQIISKIDPTEFESILTTQFAGQEQDEILEELTGLRQQIDNMLDKIGHR